MEDGEGDEEMKIIQRLVLAVALLLLPVISYAQLVPGTVNARQAGTWTVQPGNTANTTAWLVDVTPASPVATDYLPARITDGTVFIVPLSEGTFTGRINTQGQKTMAASTPVVIASDQGTIPTTQGALTSLVVFQQAVTATAAVLPTNTAKRVCLKVLVAGTQTVFYGPSTVTTANGQELSPGDAACLPIDNSNRIFVIAAGTGSTVAAEVLN